MGRYLISTPAQPKIHKCGALILEGLCEGLSARVDPFPAGPAAEAAALILGRWAYVLTSQKILERRMGSIRPGPVLIEHRCGSQCWTPPPVSRPDLLAAKINNSVIPAPTDEIPY